MSAKHMRLRYYTSFEEAILVSLWRENLASIPSYTDNLPIFREIANGLQEYGIKLNKQEVRRRLNSYKNKYTTEIGRIAADKDYVSEWRLFPLVDCVLNPDKPVDVHHQRKVLARAETRVRQEIPELRPFVIKPINHIQIHHDPDGCAFLESDDNEVQEGKTDTHYTEPSYGQYKTEEQIVDADILPAKRSPLTPANRILETWPEDSSPFTVPNSASFTRRVRRRSIMPRAGSITLAQIEHLRKENELLEEQNDCFLADLEMKELQLKIMEQNFHLWMEGQDNVLKNLQQIAVK